MTLAPEPTRAPYTPNNPGEQASRVTEGMAVRLRHGGPLKTRRAVARSCDECARLSGGSFWEDPWPR